MIEPRCIKCGRRYPSKGTPYRCPDCGGLYDYSELPDFNLSQVNHSAAGIWRYGHLLGLSSDAAQISIGEGNTPLIWRNCLGREIAFKLEYVNPTGSFKDRGTAVLISFLLSRGVSTAVEDSSGNAGASFAAYAAAAGITAEIFVPDTASGPKVAQMEAHGARVFRVPGGRSRTSEVTINAVEHGAVYGSHAYLPHNLFGYATLAYEVCAQLGRAPGTLVLPAGQGGLLLGVSRGFEALKIARIIDDLPVLIGVQAAACAPIFAGFQNGRPGVVQVEEGVTMAEGIRVRQPVRIDAVLNAIQQTNGRIVAVNEPEILTGREALARLGFYVEPTSAVIWDALKQVSDLLMDPVVVILTGTGLKSP
jgi:threonine synthase